MNREETKLFIPKTLIDDPEITGLDLAVYIQLNLCSIKLFDEPSCLGAGSIAYKLYKYSNKNRAKIQQSFQKLIIKCPTYFSSDGDKKYIITNFYNNTDEFQVRITLQEYDTIANSEYSYKFNMLKAYLVILSMARSYIKANGIGYLGTNFAYSWYANVCDCKEITFSNYVTCLEDLDLIYVYRPQDPHKTNVLAHKKYEKYIIKWTIENNYGKKESNETNKRRSLMGKYNYLVKQLDLGNPCPYSKKELKEIRAGVVAHNKYCKAQSKLDTTYLSKIKDITIIDNIAQN